MFDESDRDKLSALAQKIDKAEKAANPERPKEESESNGSKRGMVAIVRVCSDLIALILGLGYLGWLIDGRLGTAPWFMVTLVFVGFAAGFWILVRTFSNKQDQEEADRKGEKKE